MKLTLRSEYALLALIHLTRNSEKGFITAQGIATAQNIPQTFLEQILLQLKRARLLRGVRGKHGGYQLGREPARISLAEVIRLFDGALAPTQSVSTYFHESTPIHTEKKLLKVFKAVRDFAADMMEHTTLADVA